MSKTLRDREGKIIQRWTAKTTRGFNQRQWREITRTGEGLYVFEGDIGELREEEMRGLVLIVRKAKR